MWAKIRSQSSLDRSKESSLSQCWLIALDLGLQSKNRSEYMAEIKCLWGSVLVQMAAKGM